MAFLTTDDSLRSIQDFYGKMYLDVEKRDRWVPKVERGFNGGSLGMYNYYLSINNLTYLHCHESK